MLKNKKLTAVICILLSLSTLMSCAVKETAGTASEGKENVSTEAPVNTEEQSQETESESDGTSEEPGYHKYENVQNENDTFVRDRITLNNTDYVISAEAEQGLYDVILNEYGGYYDTSFYVLDLGSGMSFGYNAADYFEPACTRKAGLALSWFRMLEEARISKENGTPIPEGENTLTMESRYYYDGTDYMDGNGYLGRHDYRWYTLREVLYWMIHESDNTSYKAMWGLLGCEKYNEMCVELGIPQHPNEYRRDKLFTPTRALDLGLVWQEIWKYKATDTPEARDMWDFLTHNMFNQIGKVVQGADEIAHKSGQDEWGYHDAGIVVRGDDAYVVVALSTVPFSLVDRDYDIIHKIYERVDLIMQDYYEWYDENIEAES